MRSLRAFIDDDARVERQGHEEEVGDRGDQDAELHVGAYEDVKASEKSGFVDDGRDEVDAVKRAST